jgi:Ca-activated chloride channel family protein
MKRILRATMVWTSPLFFVLAGGVAQAQTGDAILILDASGSMWGQVEGQTKISAARRAVDSILATWRPADRLGLMAYGHRTKGECKDIELIVPVGDFDAERIRGAVRALSPKGRTPIADSLKAAAQALRSSENKATVILVSDGIETCAPDPCAVAAELKKAGVGFTAHVIGFDVADPAAKNQLQCIARATGGVYLDARNAEGLENALGRAVQAVQGANVQSEAPARPAAEDPFKDKNFRGTVRLSKDSDPLTDPAVAFIFFKPNAAGEKADTVTQAYGSPAAEPVPPGDYIVEVQYGQVVRNVKFRVEPRKPAILEVVLEAGYVTSDGSVEGAGKADGVVWEIHDRAGNHVATDYEAVPKFVLPAGDYTMTLVKGLSRTSKPFSVAAGDSINVSMTIDVGRLLVRGVYAANGPKIEDGFVVEVRRPAKADGEEGEHLATDYQPQSRFDLPAGEYDVVAVVGLAKAVQRVSVKSGAPTQVTIALNAGVAGITAPGARVIELFGAERDINNNRKYVSTHYEPGWNVALNAGAYVAVVTYADDRKVERTFTVSPGKRVEVAIAK